MLPNQEQLMALFSGEFITSLPHLQEKLSNVRAYVFDWDGVFNEGFKNEQGSSAFSEIDAMGINLLRWSHYLQFQQQPFVAVISGEKNPMAVHFTEREHFHAHYFQIRHKQEALHHFCLQHELQPGEVFFLYDDVLDISLAALAGLRFAVPHGSSPLFREFLLQHRHVDYFTGGSGQEHAVRESCELLMALRGNYETSLQGRIQFSDQYQHYFRTRQSISTRHFTADASHQIQPVSL